MGELLDLPYTNIITSKVKKRHPTQSTSIIIRYPLGNTTVTRKKIAIVGEISSVERLDKIIVYINGNDIEEISFRELHESNFKNIPLEVVGDLNLGENTITVSALMRDGHKIEKQVIVKRIEHVEPIDSFAKTIRERWAVVIGISKYKYSFILN